MTKHWLAWATIPLIGIGSAWASDPAPAAPEGSEEAPPALTLDYESSEHEGRPGAWIPAAELEKLNLWQIELRESRDLALLEARREALQADLDAIRAEGQALDTKRLELEIERTALAEEEAELERKRANRAERRGLVSRILGAVGLVTGAFLAR